MTDVFFPVELDIAVEGELLGTQWEVSGAPSRCVLRLPRRIAGPMPEAGMDRRLSGPDLGGAEAAVEEWRRAVLTDDEGVAFTMWGAVSAWNPERDRILAAAVPRAVAVSTYAGEDSDEARLAFAAATHEALASWLASLIDWLEVVSGKVVVAIGSGIGPTPPAERESLCVDAGSGRLRRFARPPQVIYVTRRGNVDVSHADWTTATRQVNAGTVPALAHLLLRDARHALLTDDYRRAVIDAATASEVAMAEAIRVNFATLLPPAAIDQFFDTTSGLMELYDMCVEGLEIIGQVSRGRLSHRLAGVRNRVAHDGYRPTRAEARDAIEVAAALVAEVAPLPPPP